LKNYFSNIAFGQNDFSIRLWRILSLYTRPYRREKRLAIPQSGILLLRNSEPRFAGAKGFCFVQKSLENIGKSARRGAKRRGGYL